MSCSESSTICPFYETGSGPQNGQGYYDPTTKACYMVSPCISKYRMGYQMAYNVPGEDSGCFTVASGAPDYYTNYNECDTLYDDFVHHADPACPFQYSSVGGPLYPGAPPLKDLPLVKKMQDGKAICVGKTTGDSYVYAQPLKSPSSLNRPMAAGECGGGCIGSASPLASNHRAGCSFQGVYFSPF